ncbi:hypothetical protein ACFQDF_07785 [Ectobacillus funiculus]
MKLLEGRNLRNYSVSLKKEHLFLHTVFSSVLKDPAERLLKAFQSFFKGHTGYPNFRSWKKKWYSLIYDEPNKGWELQREGTALSISLGKIPNIRSFVCVSCGTEILRDNNSAVNIGKKVGYSLPVPAYKQKLNSFTYKGEANFGQKVVWLENNL